MKALLIHCALMALLGAVAVIHGATTLTEGDTPALMFKTLTATDGVIIGGAYGTISQTEGLIGSQTRGSGTANGKVVGPDSCFQMGTMSELLVIYATLKLQNDLSFAVSLSEPIATALSPSGLSLTNPHNQGTISYQDLMQHTSSLLDITFDSSTLVAPNTVGTLAAFIDAYFVTNGGQLVSTVFSSTLTPGQSDSYNFQRINIALLAYICERVIANNNLPYTSLKHYIADQVLKPFGMSSTFFLDVDGSAPGLVPPPDFTGTFTNPASISSTSAYSAYFQGCIVDQSSTSINIHPAYPADYMAYTTINDVLAMAHALTIDTAFQTLALSMQTSITVSSTSTTQQTGQGKGLRFYDGTAVCSPALQSLVIADCWLANGTTTLMGYTSEGQSGVSGFMCTSTSQRGVTCAASMFVYSTSSSRGIDPILQMASASFQELEGSTTYTTPAPTTAIREGDDELWFGVYVFIAVYGSILVVIFGTAALQYLFQPAALATNANTAAATYALTNVPTGPKGTSPRRGGSP